MHCKIEGPAAYDILTNFIQRFNKAAKVGERKIRHTPDVLINIEGIILTPSPGPGGDKPVCVRDEGDIENWHVQVGHKHKNVNGLLIFI